jgi:hypothetical protein
MRRTATLITPDGGNETQKGFGRGQQGEVEVAWDKILVIEITAASKECSTSDIIDQSPRN